MSIEALAMAGADYVECGIDLDLLDSRDREDPPPHLLADDAFEKGHDDSSDGEWYEDKGMKERLIAWAKYICCILCAKRRSMSLDSGIVRRFIFLYLYSFAITIV